MIHPQLESYIKNALSSGQQKDAITTSLLGAGWNRVDIDQAFQSLSIKLIRPQVSQSQQEPPQPTSPSRGEVSQPPVRPQPRLVTPVAVPHKGSSRTLGMILVIVVVAVVAFGVWWFYSSENAVIYSTPAAVQGTQSPAVLLPEPSIAQNEQPEILPEHNTQPSIVSIPVPKAVSVTTADPKMFVPANTKYMSSSFVDIDKDADGQKELIVFFSGESPNVGFGVYKYKGGNVQDVTSWKQEYTGTISSTSVPKVMSLGKNGTGAILISTTVDLTKKNIHMGGWFVVTEKFTGITDEDFYPRLSFMTTQFTRVDPEKVSISDGGFTQSFNPYNDYGAQPPITVHFQYKNGTVTQGAIQY